MRPRIMDVVPVDLLRELRGLGWTFAEIGEEVGFCQRTVALYAREVLTEAERERGQVERVSRKRKRVLAFLRDNGGWAGNAERLADKLGVSVALVYRALVQWRRENVRAGEGRCTRCGFLGEERNPIGEDKLCLWCELEQAGMSVLEFHQSGCAVEMLGEDVLRH